MRVQMVDVQSAGWAADLDAIGYRLRQPQDPTLFPYHFLHGTLGRIGGHAALVHDEKGVAGVGFIFPRQRTRGGEHVYTLRYHAYPGRERIDLTDLARAVSAQLDGCAVIAYDPHAPQYYTPSHHIYGSVDIGQPDAFEAAMVPDLHKRIWGSPAEFLYPADIFSVDFAAGTGLVARVEENGASPMVGFLVGFYKFGGTPVPADWHGRFGGDYRLESQIMGVLPEYRGLRIASILKLAQAEQSWREGVGIINWTADPLQYPNAALNFGLLRAVAFDFVGDMYPFRNNLNRVPASRFILTWLVGTQRVREHATVNATARAAVLDLSQRPEIVRVNDAWIDTELGARVPLIAVEIPANWTVLQNDDVGEALRWREATDRIFAHYIGMDTGQYTITGVGVDGERRYLVGERSEAALWHRLGAV